MALPHHQKNEGTTATGEWLSPVGKMKGSKKKCIFKNHLTDNNCTKTECLVYPQLSCRKFTYTNNADRGAPRIERLLNRTRCYPSSDLRCNPFQIPLKEIVAQEIRLCSDERCRNYSLRYIFQNFCKCDMDTLKGLLPSYQGYDNICCKRTNYSRKLADKIDPEKLEMFQKKLAETVEKTRRSLAANPYAIPGSLAVHRKCKSLASHQVPLSKDPSSPAETNYLFRSQLMEMAKRKFEENKDLSVTKASAVEFQNTEFLIDNSKIEIPIEYMSAGFGPYRADGTTTFTVPGKGLTVHNTASGTLSENGEKLLEELRVMSDELKVVSGSEGVFISPVHSLGNAEELDFTMNMNTVEATEEMGGHEEGLSEGGSALMNTVLEEKVDEETTGA